MMTVDKTLKSESHQVLVLRRYDWTDFLTWDFAS